MIGRERFRDSFGAMGRRAVVVQADGGNAAKTANNYRRR